MLHIDRPGGWRRVRGGAFDPLDLVEGGAGFDLLEVSEGASLDLLVESFEGDVPPSPSFDGVHVRNFRGEHHQNR